MSCLSYKRVTSVTDSDIPFIAAALRAELYIHIADYDGYFLYVTDSADVYFYKVYDNDNLIGVLHLENPEETVFVSVVVFEEHRRKGFGKQIVRDLINDRFALGYRVVEAGIAPSNLASRTLFEHAGFVAESQEDDVINYIYK